MATLPRITPAETNVTTLPDLNQVLKSPRKSSRSVIKTSHSLSKSWDGPSLFPWVAGDNMSEAKAVPRPDPLRPLREKTFTLDSTDSEYNNELHALQKKREQYHQFHRSWMRPFYGSKAEQEEYRASIRHILKSQMDEKQKNYQKFMTEKVQESEAAVAHDNDCINKDLTAMQKKHKYLKQFRDGNKQLIEQREILRKTERVERQKHERELLQFNPINWSQTLR